MLVAKPAPNADATTSGLILLARQTAVIQSPMRTGCVIFMAFLGAAASVAGWCCPGQMIV